MKKLCSPVFNVVAGVIVVSMGVLLLSQDTRIDDEIPVASTGNGDSTELLLSDVVEDSTKLPIEVCNQYIDAYHDSQMYDLILEQSEPYLEMSEDDKYELATLVYLESGIESYECQKAVASVIVNRMTTRDISLQEVIYEPYQFTPAERVPTSSPSQSTLDAVEEVVTEGPTLPEYVTYFRADYYFNWGDRYVEYKCIDHTYFSYDIHVKEGLSDD